MIDKSYFFDSVKVNGLFKRLTQSQVTSIESVIDYWTVTGYTDLRWLGYMFATVYHETAQTMRPIEEYGKGKGHPYGKKIKRSGIIYTCPDKIFYGRGKVQLTWYENYEFMGRLLGIDLLNKPELALDDDVSNKIMFEGMTKGLSSFGDFTGKCLEMYFNDKTEDWINPRRIINGLDSAAKIAGYGKTFLKGLKIAA